MKKLSVLLLIVLAISSCSKHDPILPGVRHDIFENTDVKVLNKDVPELSDDVKDIYGDKECEFRQDISNTIWAGDKKIFSGYANDSVVKSSQSPICVGQFVYTGLSTGEVIKINKANKKLVWMTDVFRANNLTGGAAIVDIVAHVGIDGKYVYAGGLGDAFGKLKAQSGDKIWCVDISVPVDFILVDDFAFVVGGDNNLYAINTDNGNVYWQREIKKQIKPQFENQTIRVGKQKINYKNGEIIK